MPAPQPSLQSQRSRASARRLGAAALLALGLAVQGAQAAPEAAPAPAAPASAAAGHTPGDAVLDLLREKGLLTQAAQATAQVASGVAEMAAEVESSPFIQNARDKATDLVVSAMNFLGVRYRRGGNNAETGFDCSGFTRYVFENSLGLVLPRRADQQAKNAGLQAVKKDELKPGDLVFFNTMRRAFSHVGIYVGDGKFIHSPRTGGEVRIEDMRQAYWAKRFNGARRAEMPVLEATVKQ